MFINYLFANIKDYTDQEYTEFYQRTPEWRRFRIDKITDSKNRKQSLLASELAYQLFELKHASEAYQKMYIDENGKPTILAKYGLYFSISHSGNYVLVAISDHEVGVDIEKLKDANLEIAKKYFNDAENAMIFASDDPVISFYSIWTLKEAYLKAIGAGLKKPLNSVSIKKTFGKFKLTDKEYSVFKSNKINNDYYISIIFKK